MKYKNLEPQIFVTPLGINYIYKREFQQLISVFLQKGTSRYEVFDMAFMENPICMTADEFQTYLDREPIRQLTTLSRESLN
jgi:hypothetical protein